MPVAYEDAISQAKVFLRQHQARINPEDWIRISEQTRQHFNRDKPRELIGDITGDGTSTYTLTSIITGWSNRFSRIVSIEFPSGEQDPIILQTKKYFLYRPDNTNETLNFRFVTPGTNQTIRLNYTVPHTFSEQTSTIEDEDKMLFSLLIAHYAACVTASDFLNANRSNLANDSVSFSEKYNDMISLADKLKKTYTDMLTGGTEGKKTYASLNKDYDMITSYGQEFIVHLEDNR